MAVSGLFTYEDLYGGKYENYYHRYIPLISSSETLSVLNTTTIVPFIPTTIQEKLIVWTEIDLSTKPNKLADIIPFTYFYWVLVVLAIALILTLIIVFICYCRTFFKNYQTLRRQSLPSFYRYRTANRRVHTQNIFEPTIAPPSPSLSIPTPPCPSKSLESLNKQLSRQGLDMIHSPQIARLDIYRKEPLSTFTSSISNLSSAAHSRLSARSSDPPLKVDQLYESQSASMELRDDFNYIDY